MEHYRVTKETSPRGAYKKYVWILVKRASDKKVVAEYRRDADFKYSSSKYLIKPPAGKPITRVHQKGDKVNLREEFKQMVRDIFHVEIGR